MTMPAIHRILATTAICLAAVGLSSCKHTRDNVMPETNKIDVYFRSNVGNDDGSYLWFLGRYDGPLHFLGSISQDDLRQLATAPKSNDADLPDMDCYVHIEFHTTGEMIPGQFCWVVDNSGNIFTEKHGWVHCPSLWNKVYELMKSKYSIHLRQ